MASQILSINNEKDFIYALKMKAENSSEKMIDFYLTTHITTQRHKLKFRNEIYKYLKISCFFNSVIYQFTRARYLEIEFLPHRKHNTPPLQKPVC
jgi:hypothetical protein